MRQEDTLRGQQEESYSPLGEAAVTSESSLVDDECLILSTATGRFRGPEIEESWRGFRVNQGRSSVAGADQTRPCEVRFPEEGAVIC